MQEMEDRPVLVKSSSPGKRAKRSRYWSIHPKPEKKIPKVPGMLRRLRKTDILDTIVRYSTVANMVGSLGELERKTLGVRIFESKFNGALYRLSKKNPWELKIPPKVELARLASATRAMDEAGKKVKVA